MLHLGVWLISISECLIDFGKDASLNGRSSALSRPPEDSLSEFVVLYRNRHGTAADFRGEIILQIVTPRLAAGTASKFLYPKFGHIETDRTVDQLHRILFARLLIICVSHTTP
jgi:hypothetical protein